jgi:hypothetical protein
MRARAAAAIAMVWLFAAAGAALGGQCPGGVAPIETDRPDVTNSSVVVPRGSLQVESGINLSGRGSSQTLDATNTRLRLGIAECLEILLDLPTYFGRLRGGSASGFTDAAPGLKRQIDGLPDGFTLSATAGVSLPTGARRITGGGYGPYLQFPWARELAGGWGVSGMLTGTLRSGEIADKLVQAALVVEREVGERTDLFVEYVGDYRNVGRAGHLINAGAAWRVTHTRQIDVHFGGGLTDTAADYFFGVGYSIRFDRLF